MSGQLETDNALVVGASRGIGRAVAEAFATEGASVALAARSVDALESVSNDINGRSIVTECDLRDPELVDATVEKTVDAFGELDIVFNSAGTITRGGITETEDEELERVVDVNLVGAMRLARAAIPELRDSAGTLINVSSEAGERGIPNLSAYCASKGGLNTLTKQLAVEYADDGIRVNAIAPGTIKTSMNEEVRQRDPDWESRREENVPLGRLGTTEDVADVAVYLASEKADYVTGEIVAVDGGSSAR